MNETRLCQNPGCGKPFVPRRKNSRYCCVRCLRQHYEKTHPLVFTRNNKKWRARRKAGAQKQVILRELRYRARLALRFPDYVVKGQDMSECYSPKFCETSLEGNAFARELAIERGRRKRRIGK